MSMWFLRGGCREVCLWAQANRSIDPVLVCAGDLPARKLLASACGHALVPAGSAAPPPESIFWPLSRAKDNCGNNILAIVRPASKVVRPHDRTLTQNTREVFGSGQGSWEPAMKT